MSQLATRSSWMRNVPLATTSGFDCRSNVEEKRTGAGPDRNARVAAARSRRAHVLGVLGEHAGPRTRTPEQNPQRRV
ncbi:MAG TPA: hypothetical protein VK509_07210 [Polyangiales bacterium]|nr:hypothetical protein [Polyangiales bacterium]